jgi:protein TonB
MSSWPEQKFSVEAKAGTEATLTPFRTDHKVLTNVKKVGGSVSQPQLIFKPEVEYSEEARILKNSGDCLLELVVDEHGMPLQVHVVRGIEPGLDAKLIQAVQRYRYKPAMDNGEPVAVPITLKFRFHLQ